MSRWRPSGYTPAGLYPGANACRFRLVHIRDDGLFLVTLGDQRNRGGRLLPVFMGLHFMTVAARFRDGGEAQEIQRIGLHTAVEAEMRHITMLETWEDIDR